MAGSKVGLKASKPVLMALKLADLMVDLMVASTVVKKAVSLVA